MLRCKSRGANSKTSSACCAVNHQGNPSPNCSMYGISAYIWLIFMVNIGKYCRHGSYGLYTLGRGGVLVFNQVGIYGENWKIKTLGQFLPGTLGRHVFSILESCPKYVRVRYSIFAQGEKNMFFLLHHKSWNPK